MPTPYLFEDYFEQGDTSTSPFLSPSARRWGKNLSLKTALLAAFLLLTSFILSFYAPYYGYLSLTLVYFLVGIPALIHSVEDISNFKIDIDVLMTLAAFASIFLGSGMEGALLLVLFEISHAMEDLVTHKARGAISSLKKLSPSTALVIEENGELLERSVRDLARGTKILVKAGQVVPLDGIVLEGASLLSLVHLTGESIPISKSVGDAIPAGSNNLDGTLILEVTHSNAQSTLSRIIQLITEAQEAKPKLQLWFDRLSQRYATGIISFSASFAIITPIFFSFPLLGSEGSLYRALAFLIAASPCALILALPIAYLSAVSACARNGILLKGGVVLDALASCSAIAFDKTGTLTTGELTCLGVEGLGESVLPDFEKRAMEAAYAMEQESIHPIASAVVTYCKERSLLPAKISGLKMLPGKGLHARIISGSPLFLGHVGAAQEFLTPYLQELLADRLKVLRAQGELVSLLLFEGTPLLLRFKETVRPFLQETLQKLKEEGSYKLLMLTGDHPINAATIAAAYGIDQFYADLKPEDKLEHIGRLSQTLGVAMVGDGINDAPALARATVGIAMGKIGSTTAVETADIVLLHDNLEQLDWLLKKAKQTRTIVRQNLFVAAGAICVATIPALLGYLPLAAAVLLHEGGTILVGLNALRLLR